MDVFVKQAAVVAGAARRTATSMLGVLPSCNCNSKGIS